MKTLPIDPKGEGPIGWYNVPDPEGPAMYKSHFQKHDAGKSRPDLLPVEALEVIAQIMAHGAAKYGPENWKDCDDWNRYYAALLRHMFAWKRGEKFDKDSGFSHLAHAGANLMFLLWDESRQ